MIKHRVLEQGIGSGNRQGQNYNVKAKAWVHVIVVGHHVFIFEVNFQ